MKISVQELIVNQISDHGGTYSTVVAAVKERFDTEVILTEGGRLITANNFLLSQVEDNEKAFYSISKIVRWAIEKSLD